MRSWKLVLTLALALAVALMSSTGFAAEKKKSPLEKYKPSFDPSGAKYVMKVSNISHPAIKGIGVGFKIRDRLWEETNGQIYFDYYPFRLLGGEVEVLDQLKSNEVQGMLCSSVVVPNLSKKMGVVNLPFLINSYDKVEKFIAAGPVYKEFLDSALDQGVMGVDISGYGNYGWATTKPVAKYEDAKGLKFRIAEAPVNLSIYEAWGLNIVSMPWGDVQTSLQKGVIDALDHSPIVCNLTKKFEVAKSFTQINYAQGLFIHLVNKEWFDTLPADLQATLLKVIKEECKTSRVELKAQEEEQIAKAKEAGITFYQLSEADMDELRKRGNTVHEAFNAEVGGTFLKKVQAVMGYKP